MLALAGAHRSGKTTLARDLAQKLGVEFLETKVGGVFADLGLDPKAAMPFEQRLDVQNAILRSLETQYALRDGSFFIADRSPFDVMGYTIADIQRDTLDDDLRSRVAAHLALAAQITGEYLRGVLLLRPLRNPAEAATSAPACPYYMNHVYVLVREMMDAYGPLVQGRGFIAAEALSLDHEERMQDGMQFAESLQDLYNPKPQIWMPNS